MSNGAHLPPIHDLWYKNAIIYSLDVEKYVDSNGDGIGDFGGLTRRLDYPAGLGITCVWLQPFYPSPNRDNGYDVSDYYGVHPKHGTPGEFVEFMNHAQQIGLRVIVDLVINHTSNRHPWFQSARKDSASTYRNWYVCRRPAPTTGTRDSYSRVCRRQRGPVIRSQVSTTSTVFTSCNQISIRQIPQYSAK
jgi:maltose alpha-D-glucosyltransferase / alpha-amylase